MEESFCRPLILVHSFPFILGPFVPAARHDKVRDVVGQSASYSDFRRPCFNSYFATSALRRFSTKLERLLFSCLASARSLAFKGRSIFSEIVVSFISLADTTT